MDVAEWKKVWGKRAANAPGFRLMLRMVDLWGDCILEIHGPRHVTTSETEYNEGQLIIDEDYTIIPDLTDPATLGCLEALCRERHGDSFHLVPNVFRPNDGGATWLVDNGKEQWWEDMPAEGPNWRAECLVLALERPA